MSETPAASPAPAPVAPAAPAKAPEPPIELAPEGMLCAVCNERLRVGTRYSTVIEYVCSKLKDEGPILADKYADWRDHWVASRVQKPK